MSRQATKFPTHQVDAWCKTMRGLLTSLTATADAIEAFLNEHPDLRDAIILRLAEQDHAQIEVPPLITCHETRESGRSDVSGESQGEVGDRDRHGDRDANDSAVVGDDAGPRTGANPADQTDCESGAGGAVDADAVSHSWPDSQSDEGQPLKININDRFFDTGLLETIEVGAITAPYTSTYIRSKAVTIVARGGVCIIDVWRDSTGRIRVGCGDRELRPAVKP